MPAGKVDVNQPTPYILLCNGQLLILDAKMPSLKKSRFVLSLCPDTVWDRSPVVNQGFVRDEAKAQCFCTIVEQDQNGAIV